MARQLALRSRAYPLLGTKPRPSKLRPTRQERRHTVRVAYAVVAGTRVDKLRVLLVDDVFATAVTFDACARALRQAWPAGEVAE